MRFSVFFDEMGSLVEISRRNFVLGICMKFGGEEVF
jgi:hypothetical protein